jgi:hypothetical protein
MPAPARTQPRAVTSGACNMLEQAVSVEAFVCMRLHQKLLLSILLFGNGSVVALIASIQAARGTIGLR